MSTTVSFSISVPFQSLDYFFGRNLSSFHASFYKEMDVWCDNSCKLDISHWGEDSETLIYKFHPDLDGSDIIALSYFAVNLFVILVSYIYIKVLCSRHPQHHGIAGLRERKLTITLFVVTLGSLLTILPTIICTTVFVFHIQLLLTLSRGISIKILLITNLLFLKHELANKPYNLCHTNA